MKQLEQNSFFSRRTKKQSSVGFIRDLLSNSVADTCLKLRLSISIGTAIRPRRGISLKMGCMSTTQPISQWERENAGQ